MNTVDRMSSSMSQRRVKLRSSDLKTGAIFVALLAVVQTVVSLDWRSSSSERILRAQFRIPSEVEFSHSRYPRRGSANHIEGIIKFSQAEYGAYLSNLENPAIWNAEPIKIGRLETAPPYSPRALSWQKLPKPIFAGTTRARWGNLSREPAGNAKAGWAFCLAVRRPIGKRKSDWWRPAPKGYEHMFPLETPVQLAKYNAINCAEMGRSENPSGIILGLIDADTHTLHMIVR